MSSVLDAARVVWWPSEIDVTVVITAAGVFGHVVPVARKIFDGGYALEGPSLRASLVGLGLALPAWGVAAIVCDAVRVLPANVTIFYATAWMSLGGVLWPMYLRMRGLETPLARGPSYGGSLVGLGFGVMLLLVLEALD